MHTLSFSLSICSSLSQKHTHKQSLSPSPLSHGHTHAFYITHTHLHKHINSLSPTLPLPLSLSICVTCDDVRCSRVFLFACSLAGLAVAENYLTTFWWLFFMDPRRLTFNRHFWSSSSSLARQKGWQYSYFDSPLSDRKRKREKCESHCSIFPKKHYLKKQSNVWSW